MLSRLAKLFSGSRSSEQQEVKTPQDDSATSTTITEKESPSRWRTLTSRSKPSADTSDDSAEEKPTKKGKKDGAKKEPSKCDPGTRLELKRVDEVYDTKSNLWVVRESEVPEVQNESDKYIDYAFTINRKFIPTSDPTLPIIKTSLEIRSSFLKEVGAEVIGNVQGISWTSKPLKIDVQVFLAFLPKLQAHGDALDSKETKSEADERTLEHLSFLLTFLRTEYASVLEELASLLSHGEITFELIWAVFTPRTLLYAPCPVTGEPRAVRLLGADLCTRAPKRWRLDVEYVDYCAAYHAPSAGPGTPKFGLASLEVQSVHKFKGAARITSLPCYPMEWYPGGADALKTRLVERGRKWAALQGTHHMYYEGTGFHYKNQGYVKINISSRVMIDWKTYEQTLANYDLPDVTKYLNGEDIDRHPSSYSVSTKAANVEAEVQLEDADLMLASPIVYGFSFADKIWLEYNVDHISTFEWDEEPFENLVLARDQKQLVQSLVEAHTMDSSGFDDFVKGKGKGLVMNLFGNPGVGKSLTAEATSEHVRRPLYVVGAGDLGTSASTLDDNLTRIFKISSAWNAVLLIDEADVFLEERSLYQLERNAMVAVFLRQLEYFRGILFLTTNRVRTFDEAFQSRIHVSLHYDDLSASAKRQIWVAFLRKARPGPTAVGGSDGAVSSPQSQYAGLTKDELHELGEKKVNGRQIKNVVRTACALASSRKQEVGFKQLIEVLAMMERFDSSNAMYQ